ncbi:MAG TPA: aspartate-semialdehyde dehydrogenase [bacterium]|nr:aspartate-semialdehyde dehydrogenase [bacterium]
MKQFNVAVVGATGLVGKEVLAVLEQRDLPIRKIIPLATEESVGTIMEFAGEPHVVGRLDSDAFEDVDFAIFTATCEVSEKFAPVAAKSGAVVIDNSAHFRMAPNVPLVIPEINGNLARRHDGIIANPNCSTIQLLMVLHPINVEFGVKRAIVSTYQSVSGSGKRALDELAAQSLAMLTLKEPVVKEYPYRIAFNLLPQIGDFDEQGYSVEERKLVDETAKILGQPNILISPTCIRVPVFHCHSQSLNISLKSRASRKDVRDALSAFPGLKVVDGVLTARVGDSEGDENDYPLPSECSEQDEVFVGRIRLDDTVEFGVNLWSVMDNLRKGAALNAVQILELLI